MNSSSSQLIGIYITALPLFVVWIVGFFVAILNWKRAPKVSLLVVAAVIIGFGTAVISPLLSIWVSGMYRTGLDRDKFQLVTIAVNAIMRLLESLSWILMLVAVFVAVRRKPQVGLGLS
ncbi:MAG TPA: hypothetical protein VLZ81_09000 [Blastocatellia bacterium]|nr:hypothetical protein [Blastocatellia bacterium]